MIGTAPKRLVDDEIESGRLAQEIALLLTRDWQYSNFGPKSPVSLARSLSPQTAEDAARGNRLVMEKKANLASRPPRRRAVRRRRIGKLSRDMTTRP
jgi:hypothetical protein